MILKRVFATDRGKRARGMATARGMAGCLMLAACILPWMRAPFGQVYSAWQLPVDAGWQVRTSYFNYGVLCLICACAEFWAAWRAYREVPPMRGRVMGSAPGLITVGLFLAQYLLNDRGAIDQLAQQNNQMLLIAGHFGYSHTPEIFPLKAMGIDLSNIGTRFQLLVDQLQAGAFVLIPALCLMLYSGGTKRAALPGKRAGRALLIGAGLLFVVVIAGRPLAGMVAQNLADSAIAQGDYSGALQWLDRAVFFDPLMSQEDFYHIERGQAELFLYPARQSDDSRAYVASLLDQQKDYQGAYQLLSNTSQANRAAPWVVDQSSAALESLVESAHAAQLQYLPQKPQSIIAKDSAALPWLQVLLQTDPGNVYAQYMLGRVDYDLQEYAASKARLLASLQLVSDEAYRSSVYTYVAFSDDRLGNYVEGRSMLLEAVQLDPEYRNDVARGAISGL